MVFKKIKGIRHTLNFCVLKNLWLRSFVVGILFILVLQITQGATQADINELIKQDGEQTRKKIDEKFDNFYKDTETFISSEISKLDNMFKSAVRESLFTIALALFGIIGSIEFIISYYRIRKEKDLLIIIKNDLNELKRMSATINFSKTKNLKSVK